MKLIIVNGDTATGKTWLVSKLNANLGYDTFEKDAWKEHQYDKLRKKPGLFLWLRIEQAAWRELYATTYQHVLENAPLLIEGNFGSSRRRKLKGIVGGADVREIFCYADSKVIAQRYRDRNGRGERHAGHRDEWWGAVVWLDQMCARLGWHWVRPLSIGEAFYGVETTDISKIDYKAIVVFVTRTPESDRSNT